MRFFENLFQRQPNNPNDPDIRFGRYSDANKSIEQFEQWQLANSYYEKEQFLPAYVSFLKYLNDPKEKNVEYKLEENALNFELYQGSQKLYGTVTEDHIRAEAQIIYAQDFPTDLLRRITEKTFELEHSRFAIDKEGHLAVVFDAPMSDASPYKVYYALKELALQADKMDDLLLDEHQGFDAVDQSHLTDLPDNEKHAKYAFITQAIKATLEYVDSNPFGKDSYPGGIAYVYLDLLYRIDYLTKPEGFLMEYLERMHRLYFAADGRSQTEKNHALRLGFAQLLERPQEDYFKEFYTVPSTFGITSVSNHDHITAIIDSELPKMDWYLRNGHDRVALAIPNYITGHALFNYSHSEPEQALLHLYFKIIEEDYFKSLGFQVNFRKGPNNFLNGKSIKKAIEQVVDKYSYDFPALDPDLHKLDFQSIPEFAHSYLLMVRDLKITER